MDAEVTELGVTLREAGHRLTSPRRAVWEVLSESGSHMTAEEIAHRVQEVDPSINLSSVYRSLSLFTELGLVRESTLGSSSASHWELAHSDEQFHLKCVACGRVEHHRGDIVDQVRSHLADEHGFEAMDIELLISGLCKRCADDESSSRSNADLGGLDRHP